MTWLRPGWAQSDLGFTPIAPVHFSRWTSLALEPVSNGKEWMLGSSANHAPIRLAFFVDSLQVGGSELNAIRTLERLDRERFDVTVYHMASEGPLLERYQRLGIPMERVRIRSLD